MVLALITARASIFVVALVIIILRLLLLVDFLGCGNGILKVDRNFLLAIFCVLVRVAAVVCVVLLVVIILGEVHLDIIVVDNAVRALMMAFAFLRGNARVVVPIAFFLPESLLFV